MIGPRALGSGLRAALETPFWVDRRLAELLELHRPSAQPQDAAAALRVARGALHRLARLQRLGGPWRDTCLQRSVAACLVLRRHGTQAVLKVGARAATDAITAHAWVEAADGRVLAESPLDYITLRPIAP